MRKCRRDIENLIRQNPFKVVEKNPFSAVVHNNNNPE